MIYAIIIILIVLIIYMLANTKESYASKSEKAGVINDWFNNEKSPSYAKYKNDVVGSDILEYTGAKKLHENGELHTEKIERLIS
jgi:hypothetical protein